MKRTTIIAGITLLIAASVTCGAGNRNFSPVDYVSTLVGTQSEHKLSAGNLYPAISLPWGMNAWTPMTGNLGNGWIYTYDAHTIKGFKQTHQPSPWIGDYAQFAFMPVRDSIALDEESRASWFSHISEVAKPYYYKVYLADHDVLVEIAPTERGAILRFTFPESATSGIIFDPYEDGTQMRLDGRVLSGFISNAKHKPNENFRNWIVAEIDKDIESARTDGRNSIFNFATRRGEQVCIRVASSFVSAEQARINFKEVEGKSFDEVCNAAKDRWNEVLGRIEVESDDVDRLRTFYSCLYRSTLFPRKFYEIDAQGKPVHYSPYNGEVREGYMYTDNGFWDTFRAQFPLLSLVYPSVNAEIQQGMAHIAEENDFLPEWASPGHVGCMIGNNSASIVADAYLKDINGYGIDTLYSTLCHGTENVHQTIRSVGRLGHEYYNTLGYVPYDVGVRENTARTLEYAYDDWCMYKMASKMGRPADECAKWARRALNYRNVFDASTRLMRGRNADGTFQEPFSPYKWGDAFTEGNAWHYTWSVFHDVQGLIDLMGGRESFVEMLDSVFVVPPVYDCSYYHGRIHEITEMQVANMGNYAHGNQPAQHMLYLYDYAGEPWKCQKWVRRVLDELYSAKPDGYCGDEDNGQTSAWYIFSSMGFYPVCPAADQYAVGAPQFEKVTVSLENGKKLVIKADCPSDVYVKGLSVNGRSWKHNYLDYNTLIKGAKLSFKMDAEPCMTRGTKLDDAPYSFSRDDAFYKELGL